MLYKNAADLTVGDINIVRPFYAGVDIGLDEEVDHSEGDRLRDEELMTGENAGRVEESRRGEVFPGLRLPGITTLSPSGRLSEGIDEDWRSKDLSVLGQPGISGGGGKEFFYNHRSLLTFGRCDISLQN